MPTFSLFNAYLTHTGPISSYAIQAGPMAITRCLGTSRALCGPQELSFSPRMFALPLLLVPTPGQLALES